MKETEIRRFQARKPHTFRFLELFSLERDLSDAQASPYRLRVRLAQAVDEFADRLELEFVGVRGLKCGDLDGLQGALVEIRDASGDQMEGVAFRVVEEEHAMFSFWCSDFRVVEC